MSHLLLSNHPLHNSPNTCFAIFPCTNRDRKMKCLSEFVIHVCVRYKLQSKFISMRQVSKSQSLLSETENFSKIECGIDHSVFITFENGRNPVSLLFVLIFSVSPILSFHDDKNKKLFSEIEKVRIREAEKIINAIG